VTQDDPAGPAVTRLLRRSHLMSPEELPAAADDAARSIGARGCRIHLVARDQLVLVPLNSGDGESLTLEGTLAGRAYRASEVVAASDGSRVWVPLLDGAERLGVLELLVDGPAGADQIRDAALAVAALIAELVVSKGRTPTRSSARAGRCRWELPPRCCGGSSRR
jgi:hypothetical protein